MTSISIPWADALELTKPRIAAMALLMATLGFVLGSDGDVSYVRLAWTLLGLGLVGGSAGALNQFLEGDVDSKMERTRHRPLPAGRLSASQVLVFGLVLGFVGLMVLLSAVNAITCVLGAATLLFYLGIYTPSKQFSPTSTLIGAVPGALPPLMGWTAAEGGIGVGGLVLFAILFLWQVPHFLAIAWLYKEDYARASIPVLTVVDSDGKAVAQQMIVYSLVLLPLSLVPWMRGTAGDTYFWGAMTMGILFFICSALLGLRRNDLWARRVFVTSLVYLPVLGGLLVWDRIG